MAWLGRLSAIRWSCAMQGLRGIADLSLTFSQREDSMQDSI